VRLPHKEAIAMLHSGSANTGFNLVTQVPIPDTKPTIPYRLSYPPPAFSADGSKFAVTANDGTLYVWDVRRKIPLIVKEPDRDVHRRVTYPKFSSGILGREVLAVMEVSQLYLYIYFLYVE
jgi:WD40 repeat protein